MVDWKDVAQTIATVVFSAGGIGIVLNKIFSKALENLSNRLTQNHQLVLDKVLEDKKAHNERKNYVSKVRFDREFEIYQELSEKIFQYISAAHRVSFDKYRGSTEFTTYVNLIGSFNRLELVIYRNIAFINKNIAEKCISFHEMATEIIVNYHNDYERKEELISYSKGQKKYNDEIDYQPLIVDLKEMKLGDDIEKITDFYKEITDEIRVYLKNLEVKE